MKWRELCGLFYENKMPLHNNSKTYKTRIWSAMDVEHKKSGQTTQADIQRVRGVTMLDHIWNNYILRMQFLYLSIRFIIEKLVESRQTEMVWVTSKITWLKMCWIWILTWNYMNSYIRLYSSLGWPNSIPDSP